jgi:hypothetical protein
MGHRRGRSDPSPVWPWGSVQRAPVRPGGSLFHGRRSDRTTARVRAGDLSPALTLVRKRLSVAPRGLSRANYNPVSFVSPGW